MLTSGMWIVCINANFHGSETDFPPRKQNCPWGKEVGGGGGGTKKDSGEPILVPHQIPAKHTKHDHTLLSPILVT